MDESDKTVLTLDAGGTSLSFLAVRDGKILDQGIFKPSQPDDLDLCIQSIKDGFRELMSAIDEKPVAISFAFPGPADYENGVIGDLPNLPAFRGGVPLGPILEHEFHLPVFINNDGDLFALGETKAGFLPHVNQLLEAQKNPKRYKNLIAVTLGTGFGVGITIDGKLLQGDNNAAAEGWLLRNKQHSYTNVEDTLSIRALKRIYAEQIAMDPAKAPSPEMIYKIAKGESEGVQPAAIESYFRFGDVLGDAIASILTIIDGAVVIGGGVSGAYSLFAGPMLDELNGSFEGLNGQRFKRLVQKVYNLENDWQQKQFVKQSHDSLKVPNTNKLVNYHQDKKTPIGVARLKTEEAIAIGAYYFALDQL